jgi:hypothetical protein
MNNLSMSPILSSSILWVPALAVSLAIAGCGSKSTGGTGGEGGSEASSSSSSSSSASGSSSSSSSSTSTSSGAAAVTYEEVQTAVFTPYCAACHSGTAPTGGSSFASSYSATQAAGNTAYCPSGDTVGACTLVRVLNGSMPYGAGCTGVPANDTANPLCLTASALTTLQGWVNGGQSM